MLLAAVAGGFTAADFVILGLLLIFLIVGIAKGFLEQIIGVLSFAISFALAYFLCDIVGGIICENTGLDETVAGWFSGIFDYEKASVAVGEVSEAVAKLPLPEFIRNAIVSYATSLGEAAVDLSVVVAATLARYLIVVISFIVLFIVGKLVCLLLKLILRKLVNATPLVVIDRLLGMILGALKGALLVLFLLFLVEILPFDFLDDVRANIDASVVGGFLKENNILLQLVEKLNVF